MNWCHFINFWGQVLNWCQLIKFWGHILNWCQLINIWGHVLLIICLIPSGTTTSFATFFSDILNISRYSLNHAYYPAQPQVHDLEDNRHPLFFRIVFEYSIHQVHHLAQSQVHDLEDDRHLVPLHLSSRLLLRTPWLYCEEDAWSLVFSGHDSGKILSNMFSLP